MMPRPRTAAGTAMNRKDGGKAVEVSDWRHKAQLLFKAGKGWSRRVIPELGEGICK